MGFSAHNAGPASDYGDVHEPPGPSASTRSIRGLLLALIVAGVLPFFGVVLYQASEDFQHHRAQADQAILNLAEATAANVERILGSLDETAEGFTSLYEVRATISPDYCPHAGSSYRPSGASGVVVVVNHEGQAVCSEYGSDLPVIDQRSVDRVLREGVPVVGRPVIDETTGSWWITTVHPIGRGAFPVAGAVSVAIPTDQFQQAVDRVSLADNGVLTVHDAETRIVARSGDGGASAGRLISVAPVPPSTAPRSGLSRASSIDGIDMHWGYVTLPETDWRVYAGLPRDALMAPVYASLTRAMIGTSIAFLIVVLLAARLYRRIADPLTALVARTRSAAETTSPSIAIQGPREITDVAEQFNRTLTERDSAREEERRARQHVQSILEHAPLGIYLAAADGTLEEVNPALTELLGHASPETLVGTNIRACFRDPADYHALFAEASKTFHGQEVEWLRRDDTAVNVRLSGTAHAGEGAESTWEVTVEDITKQRHLEEQYRHALKMRVVGQLAGGVAHDFNNLLTVIAGNTELLAESVEGIVNAEGLDSLAAIKKSTEMAASLTRQLLLFSKKDVTRPETIDVNTLLDKVNTILRRLLPEDVVLDVDLQPGVGLAHIDPSQLEQVVINLAVNARDAMKDGGTLRISTFAEELGDNREPSLEHLEPGPYLVLAVGDTGVGMPDDVIGLAFEPFFTTKEQGTGLGLAMVFGVVEKAGGAITVDSTLGVGTTFKVFLPIVGSGSHTVSERPTSPGSQHVGNGEVVLLVEDHEPVRILATRTLERAGFRVVQAVNGLDGLAVAETLEHIDLILTDVVMPEMRGPAMVERLHAIRGPIRALYMSGYSAETAGPDGEHLAGHLVTKPFSPATLVQRVRAAVAEPVTALDAST